MKRTPAAPPRAAGRYFWPCAIAILLCAAGFRFFGLGQESFWFDEVHSLRKAQSGGFRAIWAALQDDVHPPFYFWILSLWIKIAPASEAGVRALSAIFGLASAAALLAWGRALRLPARATLLGALLFAVSPHAIWYSQEARMYSLEVFLGLLHFAIGSAILFGPSPGDALVHAPDRKTSRRRSIMLYMIYIISGAALLWTHFFGLFYLSAEAAAVGLFWLRLRAASAKLRERAANSRRFARASSIWSAPLFFGAASLLWFLTWLPLLFQMISRLRTGQGISWLSTMYQVTWQTPWEVMFFLINGPQIKGAPLAICHAATAALILLIVAGLPKFRRRSGSAIRRLAPCLAALILIGLPVLISLWKVIIFGGQRYLTIAVGPLCLAAGLGAHQLLLRRAPARIFLYLCLLILFLSQGLYLKQYYTGREKRLWREAVEFATINARTGDVFTTYPEYSLWTLEFYNRAGFPAMSAADALARNPPPGRIWVFALAPGGTPADGDLIHAGWRYHKSQNVAQSWSSTLVRVTLYEPPLPKPSSR